VHAFLSGLVAGYGIAVPVGAVGAYLVTLTARTSLVVGAVIGGTALASTLGSVAGPLRWVAVGVLLALAVRVAVSGVREHRAGRDGETPELHVPAHPRPLRVYGALLATTLLNPATVVYFAALVVGGGGEVGGGGARALFVAGALLASASWQLLLVLGGSTLGRLVTSRRGRLTMALVSAVIVASLAVWTIGV
jgi:arginine exporter protein ArgO